MLNKKVFTLKDKPELQRNFMLTMCLIFILLLFYIVGVLLLMNKNLPAGIDTSESDALFPNCTLLETDCTDITCGFYSSCESHDVCRVYDCDGSYGIFSKDAEGKIATKNETKPDQEAIAQEVAACSGSMELLNTQCVEGQKLIAVKLETAGQCPVGDFALVYGNEGTRPSQFIQQEDGSYLITATTCDEVTEIIPASVDGVSIELE